MEFAYFYWFSWISWIVVTFFWKKTKVQRLVSWLILVVIIFANVYITVFSYKINVSYLLLLVVSIFIMTKVKRKFFHCLIASLSIVALSTGIRLFYLYDPIIILFHPAWMLSMIIFFCMILLLKDRQTRIPLFLVSTCLSELVYSLFLANIYGAQTMGSSFFLTTTMITVLFLYVWELFENLTAKRTMLVKQSTMGQ